MTDTTTRKVRAASLVAGMTIPATGTVATVTITGHMPTTPGAAPWSSVRVALTDGSQVVYGPGRGAVFMASSAGGVYGPSEWVEVAR